MGNAKYEVGENVISDSLRRKPTLAVIRKIEASETRPDELIYYIRYFDQDYSTAVWERELTKVDKIIGEIEI